jgi:hypothetical protein
VEVRYAIIQHYERLQRPTPRRTLLLLKLVDDNSIAPNRMPGFNRASPSVAALTQSADTK